MTEKIMVSEVSEQAATILEETVETSKSDLVETKPEASENVTDSKATDSDEPKKKKKPKKSRTMMFVQDEHIILDRFGTYDELETYLNENVKGRWAFILHDRDKVEDHEGMPTMIPTRNHVHIAFQFDAPRHATSVAQMMKEEGEARKTAQNVEIFTGSGATGSMFSYLIHKTADAQVKKKYEYDVDAVRANFDYGGFVGRTSIMVEAKRLDIEDIMAKIIKGDLVKRDFYSEGSLGSREVMAAFFAMNEGKVDRAIKHAYTLRLATASEENADTGGGIAVEIIYIQGEAGSGKSKLAKTYARRRFGHYFVSGSSNDSVQEYMGEKVAIFDDARPTDFSAQDWLKLLDPYGKGASVRSRYYNKYLAVECIIITTTTPFEDFWSHTKRDGTVDEPIDQFFRRFSGVIEVVGKSLPDGSKELTGSVYAVEEVAPYKMSTRVSNVPVIHTASFKRSANPVGTIHEIVRPVDKAKSLDNILNAFS